MPLRNGIRDREYDKFDVNSSDETVVRTITDGNFTASGLTIGGRITEVTINQASWTALPTTALTDRNAISIQNTSEQEIKINYVNNVGYIGVVIPAGGERFYDVSDSIVIYGRVITGGPNVTLNIEEIA